LLVRFILSRAKWETVQWLRADSVRSQPVYCADVYGERRYQMLCEYNFSSWKWAYWCSKHVEDNSVTNILLMNKENCALKLVDEIITVIFMALISKIWILNLKINHI